MTFQEPVRLALLAIPLLLLAAYVLMLRRRERYAVRFTNIELLDKVAPDRPGWRRHVPAAALLLGLVALVVAVARPSTAVQVPREQATVMLTVDVSLSMEATDVAPSRIEAAQQAARDFVRLAPVELRIGITAFAGIAYPVLAPTTDRAAALAALDRLSLGEGTAIGEGIFASLDSLAEDPELQPAEGRPAPPAAVLVLSDGETTVGRPDLEAADAAAAAGIPVFSVSFGTDAGFVTYQGETIPVPVNEGALREVADVTGGQFFAAATEAELSTIFDQVGTEIGLEEERREITDWFAGAGLVLTLLAAAGSLLWFSRLP